MKETKLDKIIVALADVEHLAFKLRCVLSDMPEHIRQLHGSLKALLGDDES